MSNNLKLEGFKNAEGHKILTALMLMFPPGTMKVEDPESKLPSWLLEIYNSRYENNSISTNNEAPWNNLQVNSMIVYF